MPIYEYRCDECQQLFEEWRKHVEESDMLHNCPICKGQARRVMSNTSFALKGSGWYVTEYGSHCKEEKSCGTAPSTGAAGAASPEAPAGCASSGCSCAGAPKAAEASAQ